MLYKAVFCNECGQEIERTSDKPWKNTRFCDVCEKDKTGAVWIPRIFIIVFTVFGLFGIGKTFFVTEKPLNLTAKQFAETSNETKKNANKAENSAVKTVESANSNQSNLKVSDSNRTQISPEKPQKTLAAQTKNESQTSQDAPTYYCGAETKKGTPCSRKVKGGGRCWQHKGQAAILPPEKLLAVQ
ncbi:MAG TPA: hypothetical protein PKY59_07280 [Pyrinomonadaceae bacterium]|nr:hypothetical protein [Pyrinomonadaceae bacterium]